MDTKLTHITIDGFDYEVEIISRRLMGREATRIIIPTYMPNEVACRITQISVESVHKYTPEPHELWVVDNNSPAELRRWLLEDNSINLVLNKTEPIPPRYRKLGLRQFLARKLLKRHVIGDQFKDVSYANAIGLELGCKSIDSIVETVFTMHSDCLVLKMGWLSFLKSKMNDNVRAVACWRDNIRVRALHIGGLLFDFTLFDRLNMSFLHNLRQERDPGSPEYDVGDLITIRMEENGFQVYVCQNTYNEAALIEQIPLSDPLRQLHSDRCFNDEGEIFYVHLGRGAPKSFGVYNKSGKTYPEHWIRYAEDHLLS